MRAGDNPFAPGRLERVLAFDPALAGTSWQALEERWRALGCRAAVTGHRGAGKSALLREWARRGDSPVRLFFNEQKRRLSEEDQQGLAECGGRVLLVDGEDHLPWHERRRLRQSARSAGGVLVVRSRPGPWPELIRLSATVDLAAVLLERAAPQYAARLRPGLESRWRHCRGNLRELWLDWYAELAAENFCKTLTSP